MAVVPDGTETLLSPFGLGKGTVVSISGKSRTSRKRHSLKVLLNGSI